MAKIVQASDLASYAYTPYSFVWNVHLQGLFFTPYTTIHENFFKAKYYREVFALSDGEKIAMDWYEEPQPKKGDKCKRPLLVCIGGLGGGHQSMYMRATMAHAR